MAGTPYVVAHRGRDRHTWLEERRRGLGASDIPALFGESRFNSRLSLYAEKIGRAAPSPDSPPAAFGRAYEREVLLHFGDALGRDVRPDGRVLRSRRHPVLSCTLDALQYHPGGERIGAVEAKTTLDDWGRTGLPLEVELQVQAQYAVTGFDVIDIAVFNRFSCEHGFFVVPPREKTIALIIEEAERFWRDHVLAENPPDPDASDASTAAIEALYPTPILGTCIELPHHLNARRAELEELKRSIDQLDERRKQIQNEFRAAIGDAEWGVFDDDTGFSNRLEKRGAIERRQLRAVASVSKQRQRLEKRRVA